MKTTTAARKIGELMQVLIEAGVTDEFQASIAAMHLTPIGDTLERHAILAAMERAKEAK